jgi:periplasmic divalent cation tolerance protein
MTRERILTIATTFPSRDSAEACGRRLVERGLAACVQVDGPVTSIYRWRGAVELAAEWRMTCKTTPALEPACSTAILEGHDYETPQLTVAPVTASPSYAEWVHASVGGA